MSEERRPVHRNTKVIRILEVILDLAQRRGRTLEELAGRHGTSTRTIRRDLEAIREAGIELEGEDGRYRIPVKQPLFPSLQMTQDEAFLFAFCLSMVGREALPRERKQLGRLRKKVEVLLPKSVSDVADRLAALYVPMNRPVSRVEHDPEVLGPLEDAVTSQEWVRFLYTRRDEDEPAEYIVFPHALLTCYGRIYLLGHKRENLEERPVFFAVSRMGRVEILDREVEDYKALGLSTPAKISPEEITGQSFGIWQEEPIDVEVLFDAEAAESLKSTLFHPSQKVQDQPDGSVKVTLHCGGYQEILWWVLGFGEKAEVLKPESMRKDVLEILRKTLKRYQAGTD